MIKLSEIIIMIKLFLRSLLTAGLIGFYTITPCVADNSTKIGRSDIKRGVDVGQDEKNIIADFRQAGLCRNRSQIGQMVEFIRTCKPNERAYAYTTIHALAQLGANEALPVINSLAEKSAMDPSYDPSLSNLAIAARARLIAEASSANIADSKVRAFAKVRRFYQELNLTPNDLNLSLIAFNNPQKGTSINHSIHPIGIYAMRELADMIYQGAYNDYSTLPEVKALNFHNDYPSELKIQLAPLTKSERLATLIQELSHRTFGTSDRDYDLQLAINEGVLASDAASTELALMDDQRNQYNQIGHHSGFVSMFYIIAGVGDQSKIPIIKHFLNDRDPWVRHYAEITDRSLSKGIKRETVPAY